ncbi:PREDICTED: carwaprin-a-like [Thamnophis sirtalis]|uniref:Carwaprin-a-like n=1 Tax=Thamnophis sirtalis TaxID=35019 RepID=A0A6I9Y6G5_9SAUR|nr:PREDICTED: carwaprin-a-like [Thamnophis sirtalis]
MISQELLLALTLLVLGTQAASLAGKEDQAKEGYCYHLPPLGDVFDSQDCSACQKNASCSTCARDDQCPGTQKCCPGDCGYVCEDAIMGELPSQPSLSPFLPIWREAFKTCLEGSSFQPIPFW